MRLVRKLAIARAHARAFTLIKIFEEVVNVTRYRSFIKALTALLQNVVYVIVLKLVV